MDTPQEMQRRLLEDPARFADELEARGRDLQMESFPTADALGGVYVRQAEELRERLKQLPPSQS